MQASLSDHVRSDTTLPRLSLPDGKQNLLVHSCCAPCAVDIMLALLRSEIPYTIFFYNPNIHPRPEYELRKRENMRFAEQYNIPFIDADYDPDRWFERIKGLEWEPERGARCTSCFDMRFERTALYASEHSFDVITSTLGISRWKDMNQINASGERAANRYTNMHYWTYNWRKQGGSERMIRLSKDAGFYQQEYCGCVYSLRDTNAWRRSRGRAPVKIGIKFYSEQLNETTASETTNM